MSNYYSKKEVLEHQNKIHIEMICKHVNNGNAVLNNGLDVNGFCKDNNLEILSSSSM